MIQEIIEFNNEIGNDAVSPPKGLNILVDFDEKDEPIIDVGIYVSLNKQEETKFLSSNKDFFNSCAIKSTMAGIQVHQNSRFTRQIKTNSPYCIGFSFTNEAKILELGWSFTINQYFSEAINYIEKDKAVILGKIEKFRLFITNELQKELEILFKRIEGENNDRDKKNQIRLERGEKSNQEMICFLNVPNHFYKEGNEKVLSAKAQGAKGSAYSLSKELFVYPNKKEYLPHHTATFQYGYPTPQNDTNLIGDFFSKLGKGEFPRPLPIFIDKNEIGLNERFVTIFKKSGKKKNFKEILEELFESGVVEKNIQNYYLLVACKKKGGFSMQDLEFVPQFRYKLNGFSIKNIFDMPDVSDELKIETVFDFHEKVIQVLLVGKLDTNNFFNDLIPKSFKNKLNTYRLVQKYRKPIFDYIYKSKIQAISGLNFNDIITTEIKDAFTNHHRFPNKKLKEERIKILLNIYFSLNHHFDPNNLNFNKSKQFNMADTTKTLIEQTKVLVQSLETHIEKNDNDLFAFCIGQVINYLVSQNQSSNKNHSLLLPYLQKNDFETLNQKIKEDVKKYGYAINFHNKRFNKIISETSGFKPTKNLKELEMFVFAGYFAQNIIYPKS